MKSMFFTTPFIHQSAFHQCPAFPNFWRISRWCEPPASAEVLLLSARVLLVDFSTPLPKPLTSCPYAVAVEAGGEGSGMMVEPPRIYRTTWSLMCNWKGTCLSHFTVLQVGLTDEHVQFGSRLELFNYLYYPVPLCCWWCPNTKYQSILNWCGSHVASVK